MLAFRRYSAALEPFQQSGKPSIRYTRRRLQSAGGAIGLTAAAELVASYRIAFIGTAAGKVRDEIVPYARAIEPCLYRQAQIHFDHGSLRFQIEAVIEGANLFRQHVLQRLHNL
jgi:hypothetical protein